MTLASIEIARPTAALFLAVNAELARREKAAQFQSITKLKKSPFNDLWRPAPFKVYYGGRGASKDWCFAEVLVERATKETLLILCTREYQNSIADSVHRVLKNMIFRLGLNHLFDITDRSIKCPSTGSEFIFKGLHHNYEEIKSTEGVNICWVVEAQNTTEESWINLIPTIFRQDNSELWVGFNVTDEQSATHQRFVTRPPEGAIVHKVNFTENPHFPALMRKLMEADRKNSPDVYQHIWLGQPRRISSAVILGGRYRIEEFDDNLWKKADRLMFGADFGFSSDPSTLIRFFLMPNKRCRELGLIPKDDPQPAADRMFIEYEAYGHGIELDEMGEFYESVPESMNWPIKADNARPETISHIRAKWGYRISAAEKWKGSVEDGIAHMRRYVIIIHPRCVQTSSEAATYSYKVDPKTLDPNTNAPVVLPIIVDAHNHCIDGIRYGLDGHIQKGGIQGIWERLADQPV